MLIFPTAFFKDERRMNLRARKVQQYGHKEVPCRCLITWVAKTE